MEGKLSSPSSSSKGSSSQTPPKAGPGSRDDENYLVIRKQPPAYVFNDEPFELIVGLELSLQRGSPPGSEQVDITAALRVHKGDGATETDAQGVAALDVLNEGKTVVVSTTKACTLRCKIRMLGTIQREKRLPIFLHISARNTNLGISPVYSTAINVVNYKLRIAIDDSWSNIWYKDEGGRDKSMEASAELYSQDNTRHRERVPLRLTLFYAASEEGHVQTKVSNQEILRLLGSSTKLYTDKATGKATVRFRIEDVSKNHQGQDFLLQIAPDYRKGFWDIAPGFTPSVSVRSKRNKRARGGSIQGRSDKRSNTTSPVQHGDSGSSRGIGDPSARNIFGSEGISTADPNRLREAMQNVMHWTEEVVNGLYPLQWQFLGYAQHPDGSPDYNSPHYSMTNPNACISRVLSMYSDSIRENLWVLSQAVEQAASAQQPTNRESYMHRSPDSSYSTQRAPPQPPQMPPPHATGHSPPGMLPPPPGVSVQGGMHPAIASEAFRPKAPMGNEPHHMHPHHGMYPYAGGARPPHMYPHPHQPMPQQYYRRPMQARRGGIDESDPAFMPEPLPPPSLRARAGGTSPTSHADDRKPMARASPYGHDHGHGDNDDSDNQSRESEVEYVLAKQYKALRTGEMLGFPAYSSSMEILGFYRESGNKVGVGEFVPISRHADDFGPMEIIQASQILQDAIAQKSSAVHALKDWGTIANLIDHALVYDWSKDIGTSGGPSNSHSGSDQE